jgi:hypothetical protein
MEASSQFHCLANLPLVKVSQVPAGYEAGWAPEPVRYHYGKEKNPAPAGNQTPAVQPITHHYSDQYSYVQNLKIKLHLSYYYISKSNIIQKRKCKLVWWHYFDYINHVTLL